MKKYLQHILIISYLKSQDNISGHVSIFVCKNKESEPSIMPNKTCTLKCISKLKVPKQLKVVPSK